MLNDRFWICYFLFSSRINVDKEKEKIYTKYEKHFFCAKWVLISLVYLCLSLSLLFSFSVLRHIVVLHERIIGKIIISSICSRFDGILFSVYEKVQTFKERRDVQMHSMEFQ